MKGVYVNTMYVQVGIIKGKHDSNFKQCHVYQTRGYPFEDMFTNICYLLVIRYLY